MRTARRLPLAQFTSQAPALLPYPGSLDRINVQHQTEHDEDFSPGRICRLSLFGQMEGLTRLGPNLPDRLAGRAYSSDACGGGGGGVPWCKLHASGGYFPRLYTRDGTVSSVGRIWIVAARKKGLITAGVESSMYQPSQKGSLRSQIYRLLLQPPPDPTLRHWYGRVQQCHRPHADHRRRP